MVWVSVRKPLAPAVAICVLDVSFFDVKNFKIPIVISGSQMSESIKLATMRFSICLACGKANSRLRFGLDPDVGWVRNYRMITTSGEPTNNGLSRTE